MKSQRLCLILLFSFVASVLILTQAMTQTPAPASASGNGTMPSSPVLIVIVGDSTVCNYPLKEPARGWGMYIEERFKEGTVKVINLAKAGRSTKTFMSEGIWKKALAEKPDYVLIQFGHNDSHSSTHPEATDAQTDYKANLRHYIDEARAINATPIFVTPMVRRMFDANGKIVESQPPDHPLVSYANAMKEVGAEKNVPVIDLQASSRTLAEKLGPQASAELADKPSDITHFNEKGARAMADLVMRDFPAAAPKLQQYLNLQTQKP